MITNLALVTSLTIAHNRNSPSRVINLITESCLPPCDFPQLKTGCNQMKQR